MSTATAKNVNTMDRAKALVERHFAFDGTQVFRVGKDRASLPIGLYSLDDGHIDTWRSSGVNAFIHPFAVFESDAYVGQLRQLAMFNGFIAGHPESLVRITRASDFDKLKESDKIGILIGTHHGEPFRNPDDVDYFYSLGLRHCIPVTFGQNRIGTAIDEPNGGGLTSFGKAIIARMNELGMAVDLSHLSDRTKFDVIEASSKPPLISHGNVRSLCDNPRNTRDDVIKALAEAGGVLGVMPLRMMLTESEPTSLQDYINHIEHICELVGSEHVGIGTESPLEGFDTLAPENQIPLPSYMRNEGEQRKLDLTEFYDNRRFDIIVSSLLDRGFQDDDIVNIIGANFERVLREILPD